MRPELIDAFTALTTGIYVLTVRDGDRRHGMSSSTRSTTAMKSP